MTANPDGKQTQAVRRRRLPPVEDLRELFDYDRNLGRLRWLPGRGRRCKGLAGNVKADGYRHVMVDWVSYRSHRLTWKWHYGTEPAYIDHANRNKSDDRIENLREVTCSQNVLNQPSLRVNNTSGHVGVSWETFKSGRGAWLAYIGVNRSLVRLGYFSQFDAAVAARERAEVTIYGGDPHAAPDEWGHATQLEFAL